MIVEKWKPIPNHDGYLVSNLGRVRTIIRQKRKAGGGGTYSFLDPSRFKLKNIRSHLGYPITQLRSNRKKKGQCHFIHRLVLTAFDGPPPNGFVCCHLDGNRSNNSISNLIWGSQKLNQFHRIAHGTATIGELNPMAKLSLEDVLWAKRTIEAGATGRSIAKTLGVSEATISMIKHGKIWKE